jgi:hypothetical protein
MSVCTCVSNVQVRVCVLRIGEPGCVSCGKQLSEEVVCD